MTIVNMDNVKLKLNVSDDAINKLTPGSKAYVTISAASDKVYEGTVANISPEMCIRDRIRGVVNYAKKQD